MFYLPKNNWCIYLAEIFFLKVTKFVWQYFLGFFLCIFQEKIFYFFLLCFLTSHACLYFILIYLSCLVFTCAQIYLLFFLHFFISQLCFCWEWCVFWKKNVFYLSSFVRVFVCIVVSAKKQKKDDKWQNELADQCYCLIACCVLLFLFTSYTTYFFSSGVLHKNKRIGNSQEG